MEIKFCRRCGEPVEQKAEFYFACPNNHQIFVNSSPSTGIFIIDDQLNVTLSKRGIEPSIGKLDAFGGFLDGINETVEAAAIRELREETGLDVDEYEPLQYLTSATNNYLFGGELIPVITMFYWTKLTSGKQPKLLDEISEIVTLPLAEVDVSSLHGDDIPVGIKALQKKFLGKEISK